MKYQMKGNDLTIVIAIPLAIGGIEREVVSAEADSWIVFFKPGHAENNVVRCEGDIYAQQFFIASCLKNKRIIMMNVSRSE